MEMHRREDVEKKNDLTYIYIYNIVNGLGRIFHTLTTLNIVNMSQYSFNIY